MTLEFLKSDLLASANHGFFTRKGGVSTGVYDSLNCGLGSNDDQSLVHENRTRVCRAFGRNVLQLRSVHQIHSAFAVTAKSTDWSGDKPRADAMVSAQKGVALAILTADCAPILFHDSANGVVAAAHAGWKGAMTGIVENTLGKMQELGAKRAMTSIVVGPCISQKAYEVGREFFARFTAEDRGNDRFFIGGLGDRLHFDLPGFVLNRARAAGVSSVEWTGHCTFSAPDRFYSYRRTTHAGEPDYGRQISVIAL